MMKQKPDVEKNVVISILKDGISFYLVVFVYSKTKQL